MADCLTGSEVSPSRLCLACGLSQPVALQEPVWPAGWSCLGCGAKPPLREGIPLFCPDLADTLTGFDPSSYPRLAEVERHHFWFSVRNRLLTGLLNRFFPTPRRFLEIGCGTGNVLSYLLPRGDWELIAGAELHVSGLLVARSRLPPQVELVQLDARSIPAKNVFDVIGAFDVLEHIADDEAVLGEMHRALKPGGGLIIAVPQHPGLWSVADDVGHHQRRYRRGELERKVAAVGFDIIFASSYIVFLLPLLIANRWLGASRRKGLRAIKHELYLPPGINALLGGITTAEAKLTLAGARWPVGGSRIVVARRSARPGL